MAFPQLLVLTQLEQKLGLIISSLFHQLGYIASFLQF